MELVAIVDQVQEMMSAKYVALSNEREMKSYQKGEWMNIVKSFLLNERITCDEERYKNIDDLCNRIYWECKEYGVITPYLSDSSVEEIQINRWNDVKLKVSGEARPRRVESFLSPQNSCNIVQKLLRNNKATWDNNEPIKVGSIGHNTRITAIGFDIIDDDVGVFATIRRINQQGLVAKDIVGSLVDKKIWNFHYIYLKYGGSALFAGETGSGKTTYCDVLLNSAIPNWKRVHTFEKEIREVETKKYNGDINSRDCIFLNNSINFKTRPDTKDSTRNVGFKELLVADLTSNPDVQFLGEMKDDESRIAVQFANTSHQVLATLHASSALDIPDRIIDMAGGGASDAEIRRLEINVARGFPILNYQMNISNVARRMMEVVEMVVEEREGHKEIVPRILFNYQVDEYIRDSEGNPIDVKGHFTQVNIPSDNLINKLRAKGCTQDELNLILGKKVENPSKLDSELYLLDEENV